MTYILPQKAHKGCRNRMQIPHRQNERQEAMLKTNPKYVLKNYMIQEAITLAERGDFSMVETLLHIAAHPFDELPEFEYFAGETPEKHKNICLSSSSGSVRNFVSV